MLVFPEKLGQILPGGGQIVGSLAVSPHPQLSVGLLLLDILGRHLARVQEVLTHLTLKSHLGYHRHQMSVETRDQPDCLLYPSYRSALQV